MHGFYSKILKWYEKRRFKSLLAVSMIFLFTAMFLLFSATATYLSESKIRENVRSNMSIVLNQFDVYLGNYTRSIFEGFQSMEQNQELFQLRSSVRQQKGENQRAAYYIYLNKMMNQFLDANSESVSHVFANFSDGIIRLQAYDQNLIKINFSYDEWKQLFPENRYYWVNADECRDLLPDPDVGVILFRLYDTTEISDSGILLIALKKDFFSNILNISSIDPDAGLALITEFGMMDFGNENACGQIMQHQDAFLNRPFGGREITSERMDGYYFMYKSLSPTGWTLVYCVDEASISNAHYIVREVAILTVAGIAFAIIIISLLSRVFSRSLSELTRKVESENVLEQDFSLHSYAEITSLSRGLERMQTRINHLVCQIQAEQETKRKTEIALLQEQINPHFLYNTIFSIMQLCETGQMRKASEMLKRLSEFYRLGLSHGESVVTVEKEMEHIKNYLFIQHFRYADLFDYTIDCDPELLECKIPKMSIQPLVENAIYHGVKLKRGFGHICILGTLYDEKIACLEVHDDGIGMSEAAMAEIRRQLSSEQHDKSTCFGLKNVDTRIKFMFGKEYGVQVECTPNDTCVRISFFPKKN